MKTLRRLRALIACAVAFAGLSSERLSAQQTSAVEGATPPALAAGRAAGSYPLSDFDTINMFGGGLTTNLPLARPSGAGDMGIPLYLTLERRWVMMFWTDNGSYSYWPATADSLRAYPVDYSPGMLTMRVIGRNYSQQCNTGTNGLYGETVTRLSFREADGSEREFVSQKDGGFPVPNQPQPRGDNFPGEYECESANNNLGKIWVTRDGSFMTVVLDADVVVHGTAVSPGADPDVTGVMSGYLYRKDGTRFRVVQGKVTEVRNTNGRTVQYLYSADGRLTSVSDAAGRTITVSYGNTVDGHVGETYDRITFPGVNGADRTVDVHFCKLYPEEEGGTCGNYTSTTALPFFTLFERGSATTKYNPTVVSYVALPDGRRYQFTYNAYGEVTKVKLPTGGSIEYEHGSGLGAGSGVMGPGGPGGNEQIYRRVLSRRTRLEDGALATLTKYEASHGATANENPAVGWTTVIEKQIDASDPAAPAVKAATRHYFKGNITDPEAFYWHGYYLNFQHGKEYKTEWLAPSSASEATWPVLKRVTQTWEQRACVTGETCPSLIGAYPASPVDPRVRLTESSLVDTSQTSSVELAFDRYNNVTLQKERDFANSIARETVSSYVTTSAVQGKSWSYDTVPEFASNGSFPLDEMVHNRGLVQQRTVYRGPSRNVIDSQVTYSYDGAVVDSSGVTGLSTPVPVARGNLTKEARRLTDTQTIDSVRQYYDSGAVHWVKDPKNQQTTFSYQCNGTAVQTVTNPMARATSMAVDCSTGWVTSVTDPNGVVETRTYAGMLDRPDSGYTTYRKTKFTYDDNSRIIETKTDRATPADGGVRSELVYDGLGRTIEVRKYGPGNATTTVATKYDVLGRVWKVSNPYLAGETAKWTETLYDALGRPTSVTTPDGAATTTAYSGPAVTTTDPAGARKRIEYDALGRISSVKEFTASTGSAGEVTSYTYDALDQLLGVAQSGRTRSFTYDGAGRMVTAVNPESGTTCYGEYVEGVCEGRYDANGNLLKKTIRRNGNTDFLTTTMAYDSLNRMTSRSYTDNTPTVTYSYDTPVSIAGASSDSKPLGRLVQVSNSVSTTSYTWDGDGRPTASKQEVTGGGAHIFLYSYSPAGMTSMRYPSQRMVQWTYDEAGRVSSVIGASAADPYVSSVTYSPFGGIKDMVLGNGLTEKRTYGAWRGQLERIQLGTGANASAAGDWQFSYCAGAAIGSSCTTNNGNVRHQTVLPLNMTQSYDYDTLNRLKYFAESASAMSPVVCPETSTVPCREFGYDTYGNMWVEKSPILTRHPWTPTNAASFNASNQVSTGGAAFGWAGQLTSIGAHTYTYDGELRLSTVTLNGTVTEFKYDGEGRRVKKGATVYVYDALGHLAAEYGPTASSDGRLYLTSDHLGSTRVVTNQSGSVAVDGRKDYLPFGEAALAGVNGRTTGAGYGATENLGLTTNLFTGKERDAETGLDYFGARYFSAAMGRFTSTDANLTLKRILPNPQRWNRYAYVHNNPLAFVDPDGLADIAVFLTYSPADRGGHPPANWARIQDTARRNGNTLTVYSAQSQNKPTAANFAAALAKGQVTVQIGHNDLAILKAGDAPRAVATQLQDASVGNPHLQRADGVSAVAPPAVTGGVVAIFGCDSVNLSAQYPGARAFVGVDSGLGSGDMGLTGLETSIPGLLYAGQAFVDALASNGSVSDAVAKANEKINVQPELDTGDKVVEKKKP